MKDCKNGLIELPTDNALIIELFAKWIYLAPSQRLKVDDRDFYHKLDVLQLMDLYALCEMHCVDELCFVVLQIMRAKIEREPGVIIQGLLRIKHFIAVHLKHKVLTFKFNKLWRAFSKQMMIRCGY